MPAGWRSRGSWLTQLAVRVRIDLGNQHAALQLGVGGNLLAQSDVLWHQALAVAAPCGGWERGGKQGRKGAE